MAKQCDAHAPSIALLRQKVKVDFIFHLKDSTNLYSVEMEKGTSMKDAVYTLPLQVKFKEGGIGSWVEEIEGIGELSQNGIKTGYGWQFYINRDGETGLPYIVDNTAYFPGLDDFKVNSNLKVEWKYECQECDIDCNLLAELTKKTDEEFHLFTGKEFEEEIPGHKTDSEWKDNLIISEQDRLKIYRPTESDLAFSSAIEISSQDRSIHRNETERPFEYVSVVGGCQINEFRVKDAVPSSGIKNSTQTARTSNMSDSGAIKTPFVFSIPKMANIKNKSAPVTKIQKILHGISMKTTEIITRLKTVSVELKKTVRNIIQKTTGFVSQIRDRIAFALNRIIAPAIKLTQKAINFILIVPSIQLTQRTTKFIQRAKINTKKMLSYTFRIPTSVLSLILDMNYNKKRKSDKFSFVSIKQSVFSIKPQPVMKHLLIGAFALAVLIILAMKFS